MATERQTPAQVLRAVAWHRKQTPREVWPTLEFLAMSAYDIGHSEGYRQALTAAINRVRDPTALEVLRMLKRRPF